LVLSVTNIASDPSNEIKGPPWQGPCCCWISMNSRPQIQHIEQQTRTLPSGGSFYFIDGSDAIFVTDGTKLEGKRRPYSTRSLAGYV